MIQTELDLKSRIKSRLGAGRRILEFSEQSASGEYDHLSEAIQTALDLFNKYIFRLEAVHLDESADENKSIDLSSDDELLCVARVEFLRPSDSVVSGEDVFSLTARIQGGGFNYGGGYGSGYGKMDAAGRVGYGDIAFYRNQSEAIQRLTGTDPDWLWDGNQKKLVLSMPGGGYEVTYWKSYPHTLASLPSNYIHDFLKVAEGYARQILAEIRGKFGSQIPGPTGGTQTDADTQRQRGEALVQEVEERLQKLPLFALPEFG